MQFPARDEYNKTILNKNLQQLFTSQKIKGSFTMARGPSNKNYKTVWTKWDFFYWQRKFNFFKKKTT